MNRKSSAAAAALSDCDLSGTGIAAAVCRNIWFGLSYLPAEAPHPLELLTLNLEAGEFAEVQRLVT